MKKIINLLLVLAVALVQLIPTSFVKAETISGTSKDQKGSITINDAIKDKTYTIYRIFDLESYSYDKDTNGTISNVAFSYKVASKWTAFINQNTIKGVYVNVDAAGYVTWVKNANVEEFAKLAIEYAKNNSIVNDGTGVASNITLTFNNLELGYYLVDSTVGTICSLNTTKPNAVINEKNGTPTIEKKVDNNGTWDSESNAKIGDKVEYQTTITVEKGAENYVLTDTMTSGLTPNHDVVVKVGDSVVATTNYTVTYNTNGFVLTFNNDYIATLAAETKIVVTYSAILNENANICYPSNCTSNDNKTYLEYGDKTDNTNKTPESKTETYTYEFKLVKTNSSNETLSGAEFKLYDAKTNGNEIKVFLVNENTNTYRVAKTQAELDKATTIKAGTAIIEGLDSDVKYYLEETKAPEGYNILTSRIEVKLNEKTINNGTSTVVEVEKRVVNNTGNELPSTGGMGTTLFITIGTMLTLAFGTILVTKLRMSKMEI